MSPRPILPRCYLLLATHYLKRAHRHGAGSLPATSVAINEPDT